MNIISDYIRLLLIKNEGILYLSFDILNPKSHLNKILSFNKKYGSYYERFSELLNSEESNFSEQEYILIKTTCRYADLINTEFKRYRKSDFLKMFYSESRLDKDLKTNEKHDFIWDKTICEIEFIEDLSSTIKYFKGKQDKTFFYRGHSNYEYKAIPSIFRGNLIKRENSMYRDLLIRNPENFDKTKSTFEKLTIMQHHGLPTRLLDITKNPMVALFFTCNDNGQNRNPGEVLIIETTEESIKYYDSDTVSILSNLAKTERTFQIGTYIKNDFNKEYTTGKLIHIIKEEKPYFQNIIEPYDLEKTLIVKPINNNDRIKRQQGFFILFGLNKNVLTPANLLLNHNSKDLFNIKTRYIVPHNLKKKILSELEIIGISSDTLFPEIDNGTQYIKDKK